MKPLAHESLVELAIGHMTVRSFLVTRHRADSEYILRPRIVDDFNFIFVLKGRPVWRIAGEPCPLTEGRLLLVPPGVRHSAHAPAQPLDFLSLHVTAHLQGGPDVFKFLRPTRLCAVRQDSALDRYLRGAAREFDRDDPQRTRAMIAHWCQLVVPEFFLDQCARRLLNPISTEPLLAALLPLLRARIDQPTTLADLQQISGYSPQYINRVFRRVLGVTALQYLARMRLEQAANLVERTDLKIAAIAREVGYDDPFYFSRQFKACFGLSPAAYRQDRTDTREPQDAA